MSMIDPKAIARRLETLERSNRRWRWGVIAALVGGVVIGSLSLLKPRIVSAQVTEQKVADPGDPLALFEDTHRMGHRAIALIEQTLKFGAPDPGSPARTTMWSLRLLACDIYKITSKNGHPTAEPEIYLYSARGASDPKVVQAFREHLKRTKLWEERFRPLATERQISAQDFLEIQFLRLQAETWLARELHKPTCP